MKIRYPFLISLLFVVLSANASPTVGLQFSGATTSFIDLGSTATAPAQFTVEAWVYYQNFPNGYILSSEEYTTGAKGFSLRSDNNKINLTIGNGSWVNVVGSTALSTNTWYHIAATCSATQIKVYINGVLDGTTALSVPMAISSKNLRIGDSPSWTGRMFNGIMADLRFWNVERTATEIQANMSTSLTGTETGLIANWKMNEGTGTAVADVKGTYPITIGTNVSWYLSTAITVTGSPISTTGGTSQMAVIINGIAASARSIVWSVSDPKIATINADGLLSAKGNGIVTVTATLTNGTGVTGTAQIVVSNQPSKHIYLDFEPSQAGSSTFPTTNPDANGNYWNSVTNNTVASGSLALKDKTGMASGFSILTLVDFTVNSSNGVMGLATPSASLLGEFAIPTATEDFFYLDNQTTRSLKITGLSKDKGYKFYAYGCRIATDTRISKYTFIGTTTVSGTQQTTGTNLGGTGINGNNSTVFSTPIMAPDANGEVKFELGYVTGMAYINIMKIEEYNVNVASINVTGAAISTNAGTSQMTATILPANATEKGINWSVDNQSIATIDANGLLTAKTNGTVKVTATTKESGSTVSGSLDIIISGQITVPGIPTNVSATVGNAKACISFSPPASNGGSAVTNYMVTSTPGNLTASGSTSPLVLSGLTNGQAYTFSVAAINAVGTGPGATTGPLTPDETAHIINVSSATAVSALTLTPVSDITVAGEATLTVNQPTTVNSLTIAPRGKLSLGSNTLTALNGITLQSDASGTATLMDSYASPTVAATVEQYVQAGRNWYMSSPITSASYTLLNRGASVVEWNEVSKVWDNVTAGTLTKGKGYIQVANATQGTTGTVDFNGITNSGDVSIALTRTESGSNRGFNLVGNPYPSYLDWKKVAAANTNVLPTVWFRTKKTVEAGGGYTFATVNVAAYLDNNENSPVIANNNSQTNITTYIPPMQAYWVRLNENPVTTNFVVTNAMRDHADNAGNLFKAPKQKAVSQQLIRLQVSDGTMSDEAVLYFNSNASNGYDKYDSPKMAGNSSAPEVYMLSEGERLVINGLSSAAGIPDQVVGFSYGTGGDLKIKATEITNIDGSTFIYLWDDVTKTETALTPETEYEFTTTPATNNESRFSLRFRVPGTVTGTDAIAKLGVKVFANAQNQITINTFGECRYSVFNMVGQLVANGITTAGHATVSVSSQNAMYIVKVIGNRKELTQRVIIK